MNHVKPVPLYERVKLHLLERIQSGEWPDGAKIPSEYELMEILGASRMTVHRALREMQADGFAAPRARCGEFCAGAEAALGIIGNYRYRR